MATRKKISKITKFMPVIVIAAILFMVYFSTSGQTAQFGAAMRKTAAISGPGTPSSGIQPIPMKLPNLVPVKVSALLNVNIGGVPYCDYTMFSKNIGGANAVGTYSAAIYTVPKPNTIGGNILIDTCLMQQNNLAPGQTDSCKKPQGLLAKCASSVILTVDVLKQIKESNENDNSITYDIPLPNLKPTRCEPTYVITDEDPNGTFDEHTYTVYIKNTGTEYASNPRILLSAEKGIWWMRPQCIIAGIAAGKEESCKISNHRLKPGETSKITITADDNNNIFESDETDNVLKDISCPPPDFTITDLKVLDEFEQNKIIGVSFKIKNLGADYTSGKIYYTVLRYDPLAEDGFTVTTGGAIDSLKSGESSEQTINQATAVFSKDVKIKVVVDDQSIIGEANEENNEAVITPYA